MCLILGVPASAGTLRGVQSGTATIAADTGSTTVTISAVDMAKSFLVFGMSVDDVRPQHSQVSGQITSAATLTFERYNPTGGPAITIHWYVAEFATGVSVQRGAAAITSPTQTVALSPGIDPARSFPIVTYRIGGATYGSDDSLRVRLTGGGSTLEFTQNDPAPNSGNGGTAEWQVIEFTGASVQTGDLAFATGDASRTAGVTSVDTAASWLIYTYKSENGTNTNIGQKLVRGRITGATTLTFDRDNTGQVIDLTWFLVEFTDGSTVQHASEAFSTTATQNDVTISPVDTGRSLAAGGYMARGGKSNYSADDNPGVGWMRLDLTGSTNLRIKRGLAAGATADMGWFVIDFVELALVKRAFLPDGTPIPDSSTLPQGTTVKFLLYINNDSGAINDVGVRDVLDAAFLYQAGTVKVANTTSSCAVVACTPAEEATIFNDVNATAPLTDAVDGDVVSYSAGSATVDAGDQYVANGRLDIAADRVWALLLTAKMKS